MLNSVPVCGKCSLTICKKLSILNISLLSRTLIDHLKIKVNLMGHHISNTVPITGALPDDKAVILREFDKAIAEFPEDELKAYRSRIWHL